MSLLSYHQSAKKATSNLECRFVLEIWSYIDISILN